MDAKTHATDSNPSGKRNGRQMRSSRSRNGRDSLVPMTMAELIWLCFLVVVIAFVLPVFDGAAALATAVIALALIAFVYFALCGVKFLGRRHGP